MMKYWFKLLIKYILYGISLGCTSFVIMCMSFYLGGGEEFLMSVFKDFSKHASGAMIIGIASGGTSVTYQFEKPSGFWKVMIHFCVGMGVFYPVSIYLGWIPYHPDRIILTVLQFLASCGIFMLIWFGFYAFNRNEADRINKRLRELEQDTSSNEV